MRTTIKTITLHYNLNMNFKRPLRFCLLLLVTLFIGSCSNRKEVPVINGHLDLSDLQIESSQIIDIDGNWFFYWNQIPINEKGEFDLSQLKKRDSISLDNGTWLENKRPSKGFGTFYIKITHPKDSVSRQLRINRVNSSAKVFVWGFPRKGLGRFSTEEKEARSDGRPLYIDIGNAGTTYVVLLVSNYNLKDGGGFPYGAEITSSERMSIQKDLLFIVQSSSALIILLIACYHIFLFFNYRNKLILFFALFYMFSILRQFFIGEVAIYAFFPNIPFDLVLLFRDLFLYCGTVFYIIFFSYVLPNKKLNLISVSTIIVYSLILLILLINQSYRSIYISIINPCLILISIGYIIYVVIQGNLEKLKSRFIMILASILGLIYLSSDFLYLQEGINSDILLIFIVLCFLSLQIKMSYNYWRDNLLRIKNLSTKVVELNKTIEIGKEERTMLLSESIQQLQSKQKLVSRLVDIKNNNTDENLNGIIAELKSTKLEESRKIILKQNLEELNSDFLQKLKRQEKNLTAGEIEICAMIRLGFSSKEICNIRAISIYTLKSARYRIRKKIKLSQDLTLKDYLQSLEF